MKLFKNNTMTLIVDPRAIGPEINNMDFVAVACVNGLEDFKNHPNAYDASILLPPTELLMAWADGNQMLMRTEYPKYLINNKDADDMIIALITEKYILKTSMIIVPLQPGSIKQNAESDPTKINLKNCIKFKLVKIVPFEMFVSKLFIIEIKFIIIIKIKVRIKSKKFLKLNLKI